MSYRVTWEQIPLGVKMRLGVRETVGSDSYRGCLSVLTFKVGSKPLHYVEIKLMPSDTYTVEMFRLMPRKGYERKTLAKAEDVYCENLGSVLLGMEKHLS